jgi:hypothetical protein
MAGVAKPYDGVHQFIANRMPARHVSEMQNVKL